MKKDSKVVLPTNLKVKTLKALNEAVKISRDPKVKNYTNLKDLNKALNK